MFLAINTSSVTLVASSVIAYRLAAGSKNPAEILKTPMATNIPTKNGMIVTAVLKPSFAPSVNVSYTLML